MQDILSVRQSVEDIFIIFPQVSFSIPQRRIILPSSSTDYQGRDIKPPFTKNLDFMLSA